MTGSSCREWVRASRSLCSGCSRESTLSPIIHARCIVAASHQQNQNHSLDAAGFPQTYCLRNGRSVLGDAEEGAGLSSSSRNSLGHGSSQAAKANFRVKAGTKLHPRTQVFSHTVLSPVCLYQWTSVSCLKSVPWASSSYPIALLLCALLSLPEERIYLYQELPYSLNLCSHCLWSLMLPSKQSPHEEKYVHLLFDNLKHPSKHPAKRIKVNFADCIF